MNASPAEVARLVTEGYRQRKCPGCPRYFWKAPWRVPMGDYCEGCRQEVKDEFRELDFEPDLNEDEDIA